MRVGSQVLTIDDFLQVVMQLLTTLSEILLGAQFEEGLAWEAGQLGMLTPEVRIERLELTVALKELPMPEGAHLH